MRVELIEFATTNNPPSAEAGDFDDLYAVFNYFIPEMSLKVLLSEEDDLGIVSSSDEKIDVNDAFDHIQEQYEARYKDGRDIYDLIYIAETGSAQGHSDVTVSMKDVQVFEDTDELPESEVGQGWLACRAWLIELPESFGEDANQVDMDAVMDFIQDNEDDVKKRIVVLK